MSAEADAFDELEIEDPDKYAKGRILKDILDSKNKFKEILEDEAERVPNEITLDRYREKLGEAVAIYLIELEPLMRREDTPDQEKLKEYWTNEISGTNGLSVADVVRNFGEDNDGDPLTKRAAVNFWRAGNRFLEKTGFYPGYDAGTPEDAPEPEDLKGLLMARGQHEAAKQLPSRFEKDTDE